MSKNIRKGIERCIERERKHGHPGRGKPESSEKIRQHWQEVARRIDRKERGK